VARRHDWPWRDRVVRQPAAGRVSGRERQMLLPVETAVRVPRRHKFRCPQRRWWPSWKRSQRHTAQRPAPSARTGEALKNTRCLRCPPNPSRWPSTPAGLAGEEGEEREEGDEGHSVGWGV
jgi:hypothetical protein